MGAYMNYFKQLRKSKKLSQSDLACIMETSKDTISRIERGDIVTDVMLWWYSQIFEIDLSELYLISREKFIQDMNKKYI